MDTFEDKIGEIDRLLESQRYRWKLEFGYISFDDIAQIIRTHIYNKFDKWDSTKSSFGAWCSKVILNQMRNQSRNHYGKLRPPCDIKIAGKICPFNAGETSCTLTKSGLKCSECKQYARWEKGKKIAYSMKLASPIEEFDCPKQYPDFDMIMSVDKFHDRMKETLSPKLSKAYDLLFVQHCSDEKVVKELGFKKTKEKNRIAGYRQLNNIKTEILSIAKKVMQDFDVVY